MLLIKKRVVERYFMLMGLVVVAMAVVLRFSGEDQLFRSLYLWPVVQSDDLLTSSLVGEGQAVDSWSLMLGFLVSSLVWTTLGTLTFLALWVSKSLVGGDAGDLMWQMAALLPAKQPLTGEPLVDPSPERAGPMKADKVFIFGMDCMAPQLVFEQWRDELPNLAKLADGGAWGDLRSTDPPITVPAWTAMMTSKDPGTLGFYGFRNRKSYDYDELYFANAAYVKEKTLWQILSRHRKSSVALGVPQTYPPKPLNGTLVGCFLTPDKDHQYTWPDEAKYELDRLAEGDYIIDVKEFRTDDKDALLEQIYTMTRRRFKVVRDWVKTKEWDFFIFVEMGVDRIHHAYWRYHDVNHRLYEKGHKFEFAIRDYYKYVDEQIGTVLPLLPKDTQIWVVSDHGARTMAGAVCVNEFFMQEGLLTLKEKPTKPRKLKTSDIDWSKTVCWGEGGYYSRIFMNVKGREPQGIIEPADYEKTRDGIKAKLEALGDDKGQPIGTKAHKPEDLYKTVNNVAPDLIVYFGDLAWRSAGSVGMGALHVFENDTGPDDANHAQNGMFILNGPGIKPGKRNGARLYDVAPTVLTTLGVPVPEDMIGKVIE